MRARPLYQRGKRRRYLHDVARWSGLGLLLLLSLSVPLAGWAQSQPDGSNRAGIVVRGVDGHVHTACVAFAEPTISGMALLERSGFDVNAQVSGSNATVCSIDGGGCNFPQDTCFCQCQGGSACRFWNYWHLEGDTWQFAASGAPVYRVKPGGVDGWTWGDGEQVSRPPAISFAEVCPLPEATAPVATNVTRTGLPTPAATADSPALATQSTPRAEAPAAPTPERDLVRYALFGVTFGVLIAAVGLAAKRRR